MAYVAAVGVQWDVLDKVVQTPLTYGVPVLGDRAQVRQLPLLSFWAASDGDDSGHHALRGTATERSVLCRGDLVVHPRRDHQGQGHRVQCPAHGAGHRRQGQRHQPPVGAGRAADGQRRKSSPRHRPTTSSATSHSSSTQVPRSWQRAAATRWPSRTPTALWSPSSTAPRQRPTTSSRWAAKSCNSPSLRPGGRPSGTSRPTAEHGRSVTIRPSVPVNFCVATTATRASHGLRKRPFTSGAVSGSSPESSSTRHKVPTTFEPPSRAREHDAEQHLRPAVALPGGNLDAPGLARIVRLLERQRRAALNLLLVEDARDRRRMTLPRWRSGCALAARSRAGPHPEWCRPRSTTHSSQVKSSSSNPWRRSSHARRPFFEKPMG